VAAATEFGCEWRSDIEAFLSLDAVRCVVMPGVAELAPSHLQQYVAFCDPSGGSGDSMTLGIAFLKDDVATLACLREVRPPFSPRDALAEFAQVLRRYGCKEVIGDAFAKGWVEDGFRSIGIKYRHADRNRSEIYLEGLAAINSRQVALLDNQRLIQQLVSLERSTSRSGKDSVDHRRNSHDDVANAGMGALIYTLSKKRSKTTLHFASIPNENSKLWFEEGIPRRQPRWAERAGEYPWERGNY
jgi:hypothetical protein